MSKHHYVAIMAGGIGSRFWPMSRTNHPKQFLDVLGTGKTLIQQTFERYIKVVPPENVYVVTSQEYVETVKTFCVKRSIKFLGKANSNADAQAAKAKATH